MFLGYDFVFLLLRQHLAALIFFSSLVNLYGIYDSITGWIYVFKNSVRDWVQPPEIENHADPDWLFSQNRKSGHWVQSCAGLKGLLSFLCHPGHWVFTMEASVSQRTAVSLVSHPHSKQGKKRNGGGGEQERRGNCQMSRAKLTQNLQSTFSSASLARIVSQATPSYKEAEKQRIFIGLPLQTELLFFWVRNIWGKWLEIIYPLFLHLSKSRVEQYVLSACFFSPPVPPLTTWLRMYIFTLRLQEFKHKIFIHPFH